MHGLILILIVERKACSTLSVPVALRDSGRKNLDPIEAS